MRQASEPKRLRLHRVRFAQEHGVKAAARAFRTTPKTVRKWRDRYTGHLESLQDLSRASGHLYYRLTRALQFILTPLAPDRQMFGGRLQNG
jgi:transposase-like protein